MHQRVEEPCSSQLRLSHFHPGDAGLVIGDDEAARQKTTVPVNIEHQIAVDRNAVVANAKVIAEDSSRQLQSRVRWAVQGAGLKVTQRRGA